MKATAKKTETKRTTATKAAAKKPAAKKPAAKKAPAAKKPAASKASAPKIVLQYGELSIDQETLLRNVENYLAYDKNVPAADQTGVEIYVKPEEGRAYIVMKGEEEGSIML